MQLISYCLEINQIYFGFCQKIMNFVQIVCFFLMGKAIAKIRFLWKVKLIFRQQRSRYTVMCCCMKSCVVCVMCRLLPESTCCWFCWCFKNEKGNNIRVYAHNRKLEHGEVTGWYVDDLLLYFFVLNSVTRSNDFMSF